MERREWLKERQKGIGGTDIAALCGLGFRTPADVYAEKLAPEPSDDAGSALMQMGLATEQHNATLYSRRTGRRLVAPALMRSSAHDFHWCFATFDRLSCDTEAAPGGPVELKYTPRFGETWGPDGSDEVRDAYLVQATWQMLVLRDNGHAVASADLSALDGFGEHRVYTIPFVPELASALRLIGKSFWERVVARDGLQGWQAPAEAELRALLADFRPGSAVELGHDAAELVAEIDRLSLAKKAGEEAEEEIRRLKSRLATYLRGAEVGRLPDGRRVKQYRHPEKLVTPKPYVREERLEVRILQPLKGRQSDE